MYHLSLNSLDWYFKPESHSKAQNCLTRSIFYPVAYSYLGKHSAKPCVNRAGVTTCLLPTRPVPVATVPIDFAAGTAVLFTMWAEVELPCLGDCGRG